VGLWIGYKSGEQLMTEHRDKALGSIRSRENNYPPTGPSDFEDFYSTDWWEYVGEGIALFT
jgi:hypothetical protein